MQFGEKGRYPAVSITGSKCDLMCDHCKAHILETMPDASTPEKLINQALEAKNEGAVGILVSGGSDIYGKLPWENFVEALKFIVRTTSLHVSIHTGFLDEAQVKLIKDSGIDQALIDVIGSDEIAQRIYKLPPGVAEKSVKTLFESGIEVIPHVLAGLDHGKSSSEEHALEIISNYNPKNVVIIAMRPSRQTPMGLDKPPSPERIAELIKLAKKLMPHTLINLGCARPVGKHKAQTDMLALQAGVDGIAVPSREAYVEAERLGLDVVFKPTCCSMIGLIA